MSTVNQQPSEGTDMRFVVLLFSLLLITACYPQAHVIVTNNCSQAYLRVSRLEGAGNDDVVRGRLMPGDRVNVSLTGTTGNNKFMIEVTGFKLENNELLGSVEHSLYVSSGNGPTAPQNNYSMSVTCVGGWMNYSFR